LPQLVQEKRQSLGLAWSGKCYDMNQYFVVRIANDAQTIHYSKTLNEGPRYEDYKFTYWRGRRFAYLGDGTVKAMHTRDVKKLAPYLRNADTPWCVE
jgi:hypothetical protein